MIVLGVSGGVDSSVAAVLLKQAGADVRAVFMHNWDETGPGCRADDDRKDALRVCAALDIPFATRHFAAQYKEQVFAAFLEGYAKGTTPNPDILCNREVKFKVFLDDALAQGADRIATGHYAQTDVVKGRSRLLRGADPSKDQSYFLHAISQHALAHTVFPIGHLPKNQVRALANEHGLLTASKKDSTGICFIGERDFQQFLSTYLPAQPGDIVDDNNVVLGRHQGALYHTIGQRAPLGGVRGRPSAPWWIVAKDVGANRLIVSQDRLKLSHSTILTHPMTWIDGQPPSSRLQGQIQIRHLGKALPGTITIQDDGSAKIVMDIPHEAAAPGQSAVVYQGEVCLGGGEILKAW